MKWIPDTTARFGYRPYYDREELDIECERTVTRYLESRYGTCTWPLSTDDLTVLMEQDTSDLDMYADLTGMGEDVEGLTDFFPDRQPAVKISKRLTLDCTREHRLRSTLAHEYGHVKFHTFLWDLSRQEKPRAGSGNRKFFRVFLSLFQADQVQEDSDWMEWQAGYAGLAFLIPLNPLIRIVRGLLPESAQWLPDDAEQAVEVTSRVSATFNVAISDARERLLSLGFLQKVAGTSRIL